MKKTVFVSLIIFFAVVAGVLIFGLSQKSEQTPNSVQDVKGFTISEVSKHSSAESCWTIIHDKVYDVTSLISTHSGGAEAILKDCGKDGSVGFDTKYKDKSHSSEAVSILDTYYIGELKK